jgi:hypothetical protein
MFWGLWDLWEEEATLSMKATKKYLAFSTSTSVIATKIEDGVFPTGSTKLDYRTGHNCKM